jgi:hypothetical protein
VDAGLLSGRAAVTHWEAVDALAARHPDVTVDPSVLYIDHGDVLTSAGTASAIDACLHLVRNRLGAAAANQVARHLVVAPHREGGQAQYIDRPLPSRPSDDPISRVLEWALLHLDESLTVERLAAAQTHLHPGVPGIDRHDAGGLGPLTPPRRGPPPARVDGPACGAGRNGLRVRQRRHAAAELRLRLRDLALGIPTPVRCPRRDGLSELCATPRVWPTPGTGRPKGSRRRQPVGCAVAVHGRGTALGRHLGAGHDRPGARRGVRGGGTMSAALRWLIP